MNDSRPAVLYLHGFNSSPESSKAREFRQFCEDHACVDVLAPQLPHNPAEALQLLRELIAARCPTLLVGSSLGGFYATILSEEGEIKAALVNPAVAPCQHLGEEFLGIHRNPYTGEEYEFTRAHAEALATVTPHALRHPENFLVLLQTGDRVLDYRLAEAYYEGGRMLIQDGGSHAFDNFSDVLPQICKFGGIELT